MTRDQLDLDTIYKLLTSASQALSEALPAITEDQGPGEACEAAFVAGRIEGHAMLIRRVLESEQALKKVTDCGDDTADFPRNTGKARRFQ